MAIRPFAPEEKAAQPPSLFPDFRASIARAPGQAPVKIPQTLTETTGPSGDGIWERLMGPVSTDLTTQYAGAPLGERIILSGQVLDENKRAVPNTMIELVQANACGRYAHNYDQHDAPLDPNFTGLGRAVTDAEGRYRFITIKPGAYPWANGPNTWRPAHIHFSLVGPAFATRLVTQM
jgi:protocatechuate 3,4-dioxygenase beta subunit